MDRKKIIVNEIKYWKNSHLLPEHYCNFLLSLYTEGEDLSGSEQKQKKTNTGQTIVLILITISLVIMGLGFLVIYFTELAPVLQTAITIALSLVMLGLAFFVRKYDQRVIHLFILLAALMIFLSSIHLTASLFPESQMAILFCVLITCIFWLFIGKKYKLKYFIISGVIGILLALYFWLFS